MIRWRLTEYVWACGITTDLYGHYASFRSLVYRWFSVNRCARSKLCIDIYIPSIVWKRSVGQLLRASELCEGSVLSPLSPLYLRPRWGCMTTGQTHWFEKKKKKRKEKRDRIVPWEGKQDLGQVKRNRLKIDEKCCFFFGHLDVLRPFFASRFKAQDESQMR